MFKTKNQNFTSPVVKSSVKVSSLRQAPKKVSIFSNFKNLLSFQTQHLALAGVVVFGALLVLHVFWINGYAAKGFELKRAQTAISEQTAKQKKLLVQQSLLGSTNSLAVAEQNNLVPVTDIEYINNNNLAQAK